MDNHKKKVRAREDTNQNIPNPYEPLAGEGLAPMFISDDEFPDRPFPSSNPFHYNDVLIESSRLDRLARQMVKAGFRG